MQRIRSKAAVLAISFALVVSTGAVAHGGTDQNTAAGARKTVRAEQTAFGIGGDPSKVSRTIDMDALDTFRFVPDQLKVKRGETIRFVMRNKGQIQHEIVIGTMKDLQEHAELMKKFPEMEHEAPNMLHVAPGKSGELIWRFNRAGTFSFACLIAGHFEAGMVGTVIVT